MFVVTFIGAAARGKVAGAVGTAAMDSLWFWRYRRGGGTDGPARWEFGANVTDWSGAPAPAQFGKLVAEKALHKDLRPESARPMTNAVHWATGVGWGAAYGLATRSGRSRRSTALVRGLVFGSAVWATSYVVLPLAKVYEPIWEYDREALVKDLSAHLVYGVSAAAIFRLLSR
jgi:hypothetical protein